MHGIGLWIFISGDQVDFKKVGLKVPPELVLYLFLNISFKYSHTFLEVTFLPTAAMLLYRLPESKITVLNCTRLQNIIWQPQHRFEDSPKAKTWVFPTSVLIIKFITRKIRLVN